MLTPMQMLMIMLCYANADAYAHANANAEDVKCNALSAVSAMPMPRSCLSMLWRAMLRYTILCYACQSAMAIA